MQNSIYIKVPNDLKHFNIIKSAIKKLSSDIHFTKENTKDLIKAVKELIENAVKHAYKNSEGFIEVQLHPFEYGLRVDIRDWGFPMSPKKHQTVPIDLNADKGFNKVYNLTDQFDYINLGKDGKQFSIIKYASYNSKTQHPQNYKEEIIKAPENRKDAVVNIRSFQEGDEEGIARLIYHNYKHSYIKDSFYYPKKILESQGKKVFSIIAEFDGKIIGHFALVKMADSNIAEIGIVVVHPEFKGLGIMNKMFDKLIERAMELKMDAIFGEAIMYHILSQKSNLSHKFTESAILTGKTPKDITIEKNELTKKPLRGSVLIGYKIFNYKTKFLNVPNTYKEQIIETYQNNNLQFKKLDKSNLKPIRHSHLTYTFDPLSNIATIIINGCGQHFKHKFFLLLQQLRSKHCDMIYADINLETVIQIDNVVSTLNKRGFFYSGVRFLAHNNQDYLTLQHKNCDYIGKHNLVCYSNFCKSLLDFIKNDEKQIMFM